MLSIIRSCKYCADNGSCSYRRTILDQLRNVVAEATNVVNCKRVRPYFNPGDILTFEAWKEKVLITDDDKELICGTLVDTLKDRYGHARTYVIKVPKRVSELFEEGDKKYWLGPGEQTNQFPGVELCSNEILVFVKYMNIQRGQ
nr:hypothetical protein [Parabacteroides goldsteinii]